MSEFEDIILTALIFVFCAAILIAIQLMPTKHEEVPQETIKATPAEYNAEPPVLEQKHVWFADDTPELDEADDNFELLVEDGFAEFGNQCELGIRLGVDVYGNRAGWDMSKIKDVITAPGQFASYPNGMQKWAPHVTEEFRQIVADEWMRKDKACGNNNVWYFRTGHFSEYGKAWKQVGAHYFSTK